MKTLTVVLLGVALSGPAWASCNNSDFTGEMYRDRTSARQFDFKYRRSGRSKRCVATLRAYHLPLLDASCAIKDSWQPVGGYFRVNGKDGKGRCIVHTDSDWRPSSVRKARWDRNRKLFVVWYKNGDVLRGVER